MSVLWHAGASVGVVAVVPLWAVIPTAVAMIALHSPAQPSNDHELKACIGSLDYIMMCRGMCRWC